MDLRTLRDSDLEQAWELDRECFNLPEQRRDAFLAGAVADEFVGAFREGRLLAMSRALPLGQFFGGRPVSMGGIASVATAPHERGRGLGRRVVAGCLELMRERGDAISSLYPATTGLYRALGWELGGTSVIRSVEPGVLSALPEAPGVRLRRGSPDEIGELRLCYEALAPRVAGFLARPSHRWEHFSREWRECRVFVAEGAAGRPLGYVVYRPLAGRYSSLGDDFEIWVEDHVATSREAMLALWRLLGSWSSQVRRVLYRGPAEDPLLLLLPEQALGELAQVRWMTRMVDALRAVEDRGFPAGLECQAELSLRDEQVKSHNGSFVLSVSKGRGRLEPGGRGGVEMDVASFAALYTGWASSATLARTGRLTGGSPERHATLDAAFGANTAWMLDQF